MCLFPQNVFVKPKNDFGYFAEVPCGKCIECAKRYSDEWSLRIMDEAKQYKQNCFLTLTYNNENLPQNGCVSRREVQLFIKSLRQAVLPVKIRFFACGEYGSLRGRPHYHIIIFGWSPSDLIFLKRDKSGVSLFRSSLVERVWKKGFSSVGELTYDTALYCAKYMQKLNFRLPKELTLPFIQMSTRPGIGFNAAYEYEAALVNGYTFFRGRSLAIPRYYLKIFERDGLHSLFIYKQKRTVLGEISRNRNDLKQRIKKFKTFLGVPVDISDGAVYYLIARKFSAKYFKELDYYVHDNFKI